MQKKKEKSSRSRKPKFVYLDKFMRNKIATDDMLQRLEAENMSLTKTVRQQKKKLLNQIRLTWAIGVINAIIGLIALFV